MVLFPIAAWLPGLDPPPGKAAQWGWELKRLITRCLGQGQCEGGRGAGAGEQMNETERWGFLVGDRDAWSLLYPVSQEIKSTACHTSF